MLRVLHVITTLTVGGAETALYRLVTSSCGGKYQHVVVALGGNGAMGDRLREAGVELTVFNFRQAPVKHFLALLTLIRRMRPDIVQTWMYHADMFGGLAARLSGNQNVIWGIRASELTDGDARATVAVRKICAWLSHWVPHTIVCVAERARHVHARVGYDPSRMVVVPNGFDFRLMATGADQRRAMRAECGFLADDVVIGNLGRFNSAKDQRNFVQAAGRLAQRRAAVRFLMIGRDVHAANKVLAGWIAQTGYPDRFVLLGERSDVPACLAAMDVFCLSSRSEGFPNAVGEAMTMGLPCVVTDVGDAAMLVGDAGVVVPKENPNALADGLDSLVSMAPEVRAELGRKASARIRTEFTMDLIRERYESIYQCITQESRS